MCLGWSGSVRATSIPQRDRWASGGPHLLAVDDPLVAVADGPGAEAGDVAAGARLAEHLAPHLLAGEERAEVALLLGRRSRGRTTVGAPMPWPMGLRASGLGAPVPASDRGDHPLELGAEAEAAVALVEVDPGQPGVELGAEERDRIGARRRVVGDQLLGRLPDPRLVGDRWRGRRGRGQVGHGPRT